MNPITIWFIVLVATLIINFVVMPLAGFVLIHFDQDTVAIIVLFVLGWAIQLAYVVEVIGIVYCILANIFGF